MDKATESKLAARERDPVWAHEAQEATFQAEVDIRKQQSEANVPRWTAAVTAEAESREDEALARIGQSSIHGRLWSWCAP
jgi:hypothetical protein